jgi:hypothetical protein
MLIRLYTTTNICSEMVFEISRLFPKEKGQKGKQWPQGNAKSQ